MKRIISILVAGLAVVFGLTSPANADTYEQWMMRPGRICLEDNGWTRWPTSQATQSWDRSNAWVVAWDDCSSQPRGNVIKMKVYYDSTVAACAKVGSEGNAYTWTYIYGRWVWAPDAMTIWLNMAPEAKNGCYSTSHQLAHIISHEIGHGIGMGHSTSDTVMGSWAYAWPTDRDISNANGIYK
jgi:hypothetical protein